MVLYVYTEIKQERFMYFGTNKKKNSTLKFTEGKNNWCWCFHIVVNRETNCSGILVIL